MPTAASKPQSHRVYWQQRLSGNGSTSSANSNNNLITGSAAVKISHSARACDLTNLLRKTLHLGGSSKNDRDAKGGSNRNDSLVLVGTLRSVPTDYVRFEHEQEPHCSSQNEENIPSDIVNEGGSVASTTTSTSMMEDFHVVKTLQSNDACLSVLQDMKAHLLERQRAMDVKISRVREAASPTRRNVLSLRPTIAPQTRWYYVPDTTPENSTSKQPTMSSCLELDGYVTSFDDEEEEEEESEDEHDCNSDNDVCDSDHEAFYGDDEDLLRRALAPFDESDNREDPADMSSTKEENESIKRRRKRTTPTAEKTAREWRRYLQISQSHAAADKTNVSTSTLAGFLLKRSSDDPHVWKRHYCVLTQDDFWYVPRVVRPDEFLLLDEEEKVHDDENTPDFETRTIEIAPSHGRILLAEATLLGPFQAKTRKDGFELVSGDGKTHKFRACSPTVSAGAATVASIASAKEWQRMIKTRIRDALENSLTKHADLLLTEETVARNDRWRNFLLDENDNGIPPLLKNGFDSSEDVSSLLRSRVLRFGLDVAEYKEGCRQIQTLLWADMAGRPSSSSAAVGAIKKLLKELWREASSLMNEAIQLNTTIVGNSTSSSTPSPHRRGLETLCHHIEYVITQKRRRPSQQSLKESASNESVANDASIGDRKHREEYPHQRDPPPIDLFDLLWNELRTLG
mmetsp:Transcript_8454/g.20784  ORF Transcript_8454/g.20784 Transcript_8454/m.20784 type:complete len:685 (-) Transcript_8454:123-2177(-)